MTSRRGITLAEIMVVVLIIGLLAALSLPVFNRIQRTTISKRYISELRQIRDAVDRYALEKGAFPPNGSNVLHKNLAGYVPAKLMSAPATPLGGIWDWDYQKNGKATISVGSFTADDEQLLDIDRSIDDGNLSTGTFRKTAAKVQYIMQK